MRLAWLAIGLLMLAAPGAALAQNTAQELQESRRRLEEIRIERERLARQQQRLQGQAHDVADELDNLERQRQSTSRIVNEIERQISGLESQMDRSTAELVLAQDNLAERRAVLERRLVDIYKRGPLYTFQVLLAAESFGDLLSRYKYLYLTSRQDRALLADVEHLRNRVAQQRQELMRVREQLDNTRTEREEELSRYGQLAQQRSRRLATLQRSARETERRLAQLERDAARLTDVLASLERARLEEAERARRASASAGTPAAPPERGTITTASLGRLDWPVDGRIVFQFGRQTLPTGGVVRNNGIGIAAAPGTPVRAVEAGTVALVERLSTYGLSVIVAHGDGYYSLYMQLRSASVTRGDAVRRGQVIGAVGGENSDYGPHLQFQIRGDNEVALDPTEWLRRR
ncbi:MAG TPA: peptidoglycan DD-metalloendopeptidase family protein [Gemmatimonadales bacterium]|nr:peptidoglycan DD-metalloendopeptidase family protein [Gemmatimonadales bacterium]